MTIDRNNIQDESCDLSNLTQPVMTSQIYDNHISVIENSTPGMPPLMLPMHFIPNTAYCFSLPISHHVFNTRIPSPNYLNRELTSYIGNIETEAAIEGAHAEIQTEQHRYFETILLPPAQSIDEIEALELEDNEESDVMEIS
ncbi:MAG TPA: hypothetical protein QKA08_02580 [Candidatus Megaira endosymbiont of Nemacystus decipiens]|nr:hypothetical protein [Candidatus Megaera endosymbiont of Nemacystus decipiens]